MNKSEENSFEMENQNSDEDQQVSETETLNTSKTNTPNTKNQLDQLETSSSEKTKVSLPTKKPRLMIKKLVLNNFKSYAGKHEFGPFHKRFTAVVGPNGSGKSNVIDSMLFVFGKKAKQIRQRKLEELIHKSTKYPNVNETSVSVYFQEIIDGKNEEDFEIVPNSEFHVTRIVRKKGSNEYRLNGKKSLFKNINQKLKTKGIDLNYNRFLILQGEVEQISLMKPKAIRDGETGLLEYLEDIIGTDRYIPKIESTAQEVEGLSEQCTTQINRVKKLEKEKESLEGSKNEALEFLRMKKELADKTIIRFNFYKLESEGNLKVAEEKNKELTEELEQEKNTAKEQLQELENQEKEYQNFEKETQVLQKDLTKKRQSNKKIEETNITLEESMIHCLNRAKSIKKQIQKTKDQTEKNANEIESNTNTISDLKKENIELEERLVLENEKTQKVFEKVKKNTASLHVQLEDKQKEILPFNEIVNQCKSKVNVCQTEIEIIENEKNSALKQYNSTLEKIDQISQKLVNEKMDLKNQKKEQSEEKLPNVNKIRTQLEPIYQKIIKLKKEISSKQFEIEKVKNSRKAQKSQGRILTRLLKLQKLGKIQNCYGRLGSLGNIDKKYDVAISTACNSLNNIVVQTTKDAQKCIQILQSEKLGRASFIILDKIQHLKNYMEQPFDSPENTPRLFDLINPKKDIFRIAFYFGVRNTLVTKNIEKATRIAYGTKSHRRRYKVVTLQGEVIDLSGTVSGGGRKLRRGGMNTEANTISEEEFEKLLNELQQYKEELNDLNENKNEREKNLNSLENDIQNFEFTKKRIEMNINNLEKQNNKLSQHLPVLEKQIKENKKKESQISNLKIQLKEFESEYEIAKQKSQKIQLQIEKLEQQIMEAGGEDLQKQKNKEKKISQTISNNNTKINKLTVRNKTLKKKIIKDQEKIESIHKEMIDFVKQGRQHEQDKTTNLETIENLKNEIKELNKQKKEKNKSMKEILKKLNEIKKDVTVFRNKELEINEKIEENNNYINKNKLQIKKYQKELEKCSQKYNNTAKLNEDEELKIEYSDNELEEFNLSDIDYEISLLEETIKKLNPNMSAIEEYKQKEDKFNQGIQTLNEITSQRDSKREEHESWRKKRLNEFMSGFSEITLKLKEIYQMITLGGDAELELVDTLDPFSEGIIFSVRPPNKSWKNISNLSGGEKTLSSLSLVFALHYFKPTPLYFMDEIDAALDFRNVSIIANYIKERTQNAQFVIISLRNNMFELANRLIGIYKTENCTKSIAINPNSFLIDEFDQED
ncbi:structural maintenance of chromosomes protein [Anaeramoeba flamelloides]|uniref:Structural maintenance of chromosomes protein n=1 Tax=Anaeramoeba flamelloides TaxID=1746091 RepID=A0ABQ8YTU7_9EUKA|nr:structural maintenance of chromosomes protein [Anaeramoeba flamelloides]